MFVDGDPGTPRRGAPVSSSSESLVKRTVTVSSAGDTTLYTPASGKKVRLLFFSYSAGANVSGVLAGLKLDGYNGGAAIDQQYLIAPGQPYARNIQAGWRHIEGSIDGLLRVNLGAAQTVYVNVELEEV